MDAGTIRDFLRSAGHLVDRVQMEGEDRATWSLTMAAGATDEQRAAAVAAMRAFDPTAPHVRDALLTAQAQAAADQVILGAAFRLFLYMLHGPAYEITEKDLADGRALLERCFKEVAASR